MQQRCSRHPSGLVGHCNYSPFTPPGRPRASDVHWSVSLSVCRTETTRRHEAPTRKLEIDSFQPLLKQPKALTLIKWFSWITSKVNLRRMKHNKRWTTWNSLTCLESVNSWRETYSWINVAARVLCCVDAKTKISSARIPQNVHIQGGATSFVYGP